MTSCPRFMVNDLLFYSLYKYMFAQLRNIWKTIAYDAYNVCFANMKKQVDLVIVNMYF